MTRARTAAVYVLCAASLLLTFVAHLPLLGVFAGSCAVLMFARPGCTCPHCESDRAARRWVRRR